jgi:hypothetical protein
MKDFLKISFHLFEKIVKMNNISYEEVGVLDLNDKNCFKKSQKFYLVLVPFLFNISKQFVDSAVKFFKE